MFQDIAHDHQVKLAVFGIFLIKSMMVFVEAPRDLVNRLCIGTLFGFDSDLVRILGVNNVIHSGARPNFKNAPSILRDKRSNIITNLIAIHKNLFS